MRTGVLTIIDVLMLRLNIFFRAHLRIYCYSCEDCDKTFKYSGDFTKHKKEEHLHNVVKQVRPLILL